MTRFVLVSDTRRLPAYSEVADPAWVVPVIEVVGNTFGNADGLKLIEHNNAEELLKVALDLHYNVGKESGRCHENIRTHQYLESIGWTPEQIREWDFFSPKKGTEGTNGSK